MGFCFCKKCRVERKALKEKAKAQAEIADLPSYIVENYRRAHIAKLALQES